MIRLNNIVVRFGDFTALHNINVHVKEGEFFTFLGPSGCGKTTTLRTLTGFIEPAQGSALAFYRDFFTGQGWQACHWSSGGESSFIDMDGQRKQRRTAFFVKEAENRHVMVMEEMRPDIVPALLPDDVPDEIQAIVAVYDVPPHEDLALGLNMTGVACPGWQQK